MISVSRTLCLLLPVALLAACGSGPVILSEEEKAARVTINPFQETLTPDPELAAATITLPAAQPSTDWPQLGLSAAKLTGNLAAAPEFKRDWSVGIGEGSGEIKRVIAPPVVKDGRIYVIDANMKVSAFDASNGRRVLGSRWKR